MTTGFAPSNSSRANLFAALAVAAAAVFGVSERAGAAPSVGGISIPNTLSSAVFTNSVGVVHRSFAAAATSTLNCNQPYFLSPDYALLDNLPETSSTIAGYNPPGTLNLASLTGLTGGTSYCPTTVTFDAGIDATTNLPKEPVGILSASYIYQAENDPNDPYYVISNKATLANTSSQLGGISIQGQAASSGQDFYVGADTGVPGPVTGVMTFTGYPQNFLGGWFIHSRMNGATLVVKGLGPDGSVMNDVNGNPMVYTTTIGTTAPLFVNPSWTAPIYGLGVGESGGVAADPNYPWQDFAMAGLVLRNGAPVYQWTTSAKPADSALNLTVTVPAGDVPNVTSGFITSYNVYVATSAAALSSATPKSEPVSGLGPFTVTVPATNDVNTYIGIQTVGADGKSGPMSVSGQFVADPAPGADTNVVVTAGAEKVNLSWVNSAYSHNTTVKFTQGSSVKIDTLASTVTTDSLSGLTPDVPVSITVTSSNGTGNGTPVTVSATPTQQPLPQPVVQSVQSESHGVLFTLPALLSGQTYVPSCGSTSGSEVSSAAFSGTSFSASAPVGGGVYCKFVALTSDGVRSPASAEAHGTAYSQVAPVVFSEPSGNYSTTLTLTFSDPTPGVSYLYGLNGATPMTPYTTGIDLPPPADGSALTKTVSVIATAPNMDPSSLQTESFTLQEPLLGAATLAPSICVGGQMETISVPHATELDVSFNGGAMQKLTGNTYTPPVAGGDGIVYAFASGYRSSSTSFDCVAGTANSGGASSGGGTTPPSPAVKQNTTSAGAIGGPAALFIFAAAILGLSFYREQRVPVRVRAQYSQHHR